MKVRLLRGPLLAIADRTEFEAGYVATWQRVYRYAWVLTRHREDAEDVASETYRRAIGKILSVSPGGVRSLLSRALATLRRRPELLT